MTFGETFGRGRRQGAALPESLDSEDHGEKVHSRPAPLAGVRRILRPRPCRWPFCQSQASLLLAWWLGNIMIGLQACWVLLSGFCFISTLCWSVCWLVGFWMWWLGHILIGLLACWVLLSGFYFASIVCWSVCWLVGFGMLLSMQFFSCVCSCFATALHLRIALGL